MQGDHMPSDSYDVSPSPLPDPARVQSLIGPHIAEPGGLLPALHALQDALGHVPRAAMPVVAAAFNLSRAEVHGVVSYYHHFRAEPPGRHVIQVCRAESCRAMGGEELLTRLQRRFGCGEHGQAADGRYTVEPVYCLGLCALSPALTADGAVHARVTPKRLERILGELEAST